MTFADCVDNITALPWQVLHVTVTSSHRSHNDASNDSSATAAPYYFKLHSTASTYTLVITNLLHVWYHHAADPAALELERQLYVPQLKQFSVAILQSIFGDGSSATQHTARISSTHFHLSSSTTLQSVFEIEWKFDCQLIGTQLLQAEFLLQQWMLPMVAVYNATVQSMTSEHLLAVRASVNATDSAELDCAAYEPLYSTYMAKRLTKTSIIADDTANDATAERDQTATNAHGVNGTQDRNVVESPASPSASASPKLSAEEEAERERLHLQEVEEQLQAERKRKKKRAKFV